jgi:signal peptidase I
MERETHGQNGWVEAAKTVGLSLLLAFGIRSFIAEARYIPSESMLPTLEINDRLIIEKVSYHFASPQRGDIIVFTPPNEAIICSPNQPLPIKDAYIKRVIGLPGETVEIKEGKVFVDDKPLTEDYIKDTPNYPLPPVTVPNDSYLVLGDNRNQSCDSHVWGFVPKENIIGKAVVRFWPIDRLNAGLR